MSHNISSHFYDRRNIIFYVVFVTLFVLLFTSVYKPTFGYDESTMTPWLQHEDFCIPILCAITLVVTLLSRLLLVLFKRREGMSGVEYLLWQTAEWLILCLFADLFLCLMFHLSFLNLLPMVLLVGLALLVFPYALYWLIVNRMATHQQIHEMQLRMDEMQRHIQPENPEDRLEFVDEKGVVRLVTSQSAVVYIEAAGNYVDIYYQDRDRLTHFALRNTLKGIEDLCVSHGLLRCHRSYFINLYKIKLLRRDANGLFAEMNVDGVNDLPVSKNYANEITTAFSQV